MLNSELASQLRPVLTDLGYELWGIERVTYGNRTTLRIYIDSEQGIGIEDCQKASRQISAWLDVEDPVQGNYTLEVSSPGIPRPLFFPEQYPHFLGQEIQVKLYQLVNGRRNLTGILLTCNEHQLQLKVDEEVFHIDFANIVKAYLTVE